MAALVLSLPVWSTTIAWARPPCEMLLVTPQRLAPERQLDSALPPLLPGSSQRQVGTSHRGQSGTLQGANAVNGLKPAFNIAGVDFGFCFHQFIFLASAGKVHLVLTHFTAAQCQYAWQTGTPLNISQRVLKKFPREDSPRQGLASREKLFCNLLSTGLKS